MESPEAAGIVLRVNGQTQRIDGDCERSLMDFLRDDLGLTGAKKGCDGNECGTCTVLLDGKSAMSCAIPLARATGKDVITIEGLARSHGAVAADAEALHPLQAAFAENGAAQCGFCIPGMILQAEPLLRRSADPSRAEIVRRLSRNMCRCTGYQKIVDAIVDAGKRMKPGAAVRSPVSAPAAILGSRAPKQDSVAHVTGASMYAADLAHARALTIKLVRSPHHHARIVGIDTTAAQALPGVRLVLTAQDLPDSARTLTGRPQPFLLARDRVRFVGEAVAAVAAESEEIAAEAAGLIQVSYQVLDPILDPADSLDPASVPIHPPYRNWEEVSDVQVGDVETAFAEAAAVVEGTYRTAPREHAPMEPEAGVGERDGDTFVLRTPLHHPFAAQFWIARLLGVRTEQVRIICPAMGGNFGHRGDFVHAALLALVVQATGRSARIVYSREESLLGSGKTTSYLMRYRTAADAAGRLLAVDAEIIADGGCWIPHPGLSDGGKPEIAAITTFVPGPYRMPNAHVRVVEVCTNRPRSIPMRGTNIPDLAFAWESQMDMLAGRLGIDPLQLRLINALGVGDRTITGHDLDESVGARLTLEALREPYAAARRRAGQATDGPRRRGVGVAAIWYVAGGSRRQEAGGSWHGLKLGHAKAAAELQPDGTICVRSGFVEKGQGISIAVRQIAAEQLGVPLDQVTLIYGDTVAAPYPIGTSGQRTLFHAGGSAQRACAQLRDAMVDVAARALGVAPDRVDFSGSRVASPDTAAELTFADLANAFATRGVPSAYEAEFVFEPSEHGRGPVYAYSAQLVELDVDTVTGRVSVDRVTYVADPGRVINAQNLEGQVEGGVVMGLSYALKEHYVPGETRTLKKYGLPGPRDAPLRIDTLVVENPVLGGPFGAKGMAEMTASGGIASAANAIADAIGVRCHDIPALPDRIVAALHHTSSDVGFPQRLPAAGAVIDSTDLTVD